MLKFFQTEWQGIQFSSFTRTSTRELADARFYNAFYRALFSRYKGYDDLDPAWRTTKQELADWLLGRILPGKSVLSIGCGIGYVEQFLWRKQGNSLDLHVQDFAGDAQRWLREILPAERIHEAGLESEQGRYDLIYMSAVDYALPGNELIQLLAKLRACLLPGGEMIIVSASFLDDRFAQRLSRSLKGLVKCGLEALNLYNRGQFWGWMRSRREYQSILMRAGYEAISDGFIDTPNQRTYWIKGN